MKKMSFGRAAVAAALVAAPLMSFAAGDNVGHCGPGSRLFEGQSGIAPQVLAVTTNSFFGINTFAMSSGTSGCSQDGKVSSNWKMAQFIDGNKDRLARDLSRGSGESLDSLAQLLGVSDQDKAAFVRTTRDNMARIFPSAQASTEEIRAGLREVLAADTSLAAYAARV